MFKLKKVALLLSLTSLVALTSCTRYADEGELKALEDANVTAKKAEVKLNRLKSDRMKLEDELAAKKAELKKAKREIEKVKKAIN
ncbi:MAG: hypothetical protein CR982_04365 [Candidatus Cloacimonadota bacterium]|nr:MAG: hypothetical protein CR982_04365 [Candidatus Cloacimonadota bacterium]PIE79466.1 MAG: hypothetical protein CSA15_02915 [Candidatus Delongbacteria bacterium]